MYLLKDDSKNQSCVYFRVGGDGENGVVDRCLFGQGVSSRAQIRLLVEFEHVDEGHPRGEWWEILYSSRKAVVG